MRRDLIASAVAVVICTVMLGLAYPLLTTGVAQVLFPNRADGSQVKRGGKVVGSKLIAQDFQRPVLDANGKPKEDADGNPVLAPDPRTSSRGRRRPATPATRRASPTSAPTRRTCWTLPSSGSTPT